MSTKLALINRRVRTVMLMGALSTLVACAAEVGSEKWCESMKEKPKGDWTANEAADFAKHCLIK